MSLTHEPRPQGKVAIALEARDAMRAYRKGKPVAFQWPTRPVVARGRAADGDPR